MKKKLLILLAIMLIFLTGCDKKTNNEEEKKDEPVVVKKLKVYDEDSNERPVAIMIPNDQWGGAQSRHKGLQSAYMVYEIYAEGNITRFLALFKDVDLDRIGPIRSARSYYIDYALENDAIYVHWGQSDSATQDFYSMNIDRIACANYDGGYCERDRNLSAPNNGFISTKTVKELSSKLGFRTTSDNYKVLTYSIDPVDLSKDETIESADKITIKYSNIYTVNFTYDETNGYYLRDNNGTAHIDNLTNEQIHAKNIIFLDIKDANTGDAKNHINLYNIGTYNGYYITNGNAIKIAATKESRTAKTKYYDMNGNELVINDGNTFIEIAPKNTLKITAKPVETVENKTE